MEVTAKEIRAFCKGEIAHFKVPRYVRLVDGFPATVTGKTQRFLRQCEIELLGLEEAVRAATASVSPFSVQNLERRLEGFQVVV
jgi:fatty-acyl-CoA synthase